MYNRFQLAKKYLDHYFHSSNGKGHGVHSPFVFDLIKNVLNDKLKYDCYDRIESARQQLLNNDQQIEVEDLGAGSSVIKAGTRAINKIAASSLKSRKYAQLLYRIARHYKPQTIIELGTSFGITSSYLASADQHAGVYTLEGSIPVASIADEQFKKLGLNNIKLIQGNFDETLPVLLSSVQKPGLAFIDGNHRRQPTINYFNQILNRSTSSTIIILDDIHWSAEMEDAWSEIKGHPSVTLSIDLFFIGMVFLNPDFKAKQQFKIRF